MTSVKHNKISGKAASNQLSSSDNLLPDGKLPKEDLLTVDGPGLPVDVKPLSRLQLLVTRSQIFNFFKKTVYLLAKRPFKLLSRIPDSTAIMSIVLQVTTQNSKTERGAVTILAEYYTLLGRKIAVCTGEHTHTLFADPTENIVDQPCYFTPPKGSFWVRLTMQRNTIERRIAVKGSLRPRICKMRTQITLQDALVSRDDQQLRLLLDAAFASSDRIRARQLLSRLLFLQRKPQDQQTLNVIMDIDELLTSPCLGQDINQENAGVVFNYTKPLLPPYDGSYPLSKWLMAEAQQLDSASVGHTVSVSDGVDLSLRVMAVANANATFSSDVDAMKITDIPWVTADEVRAYTGQLKT